MSKTPINFDYSTADLEDFVRNVEGLNLIYRGRMVGALRSEDKEMVKLAEIFREAYRREINEDIRLMTPAFSTGFAALFAMNGGSPSQLF